MENHERGTAWSLLGKLRQTPTQVPAHHPRFDGRSDLDSCSQISEAIGLLRPDKRFQPAGLGRVRKILAD